MNDIEKMIEQFKAWLDKPGYTPSPEYNYPLQGATQVKVRHTIMTEKGWVTYEV